MQVPNCPVTGLPAARHVQWITTRLLTDLWRIEFGADVRASFEGLDRIGLWESPTGLYFFDPPREGDQAFYKQYYSRLDAPELFSAKGIRHEFEMAARWIKPNALVLDVGCGFSSFRPCIPHAHYTGLDPNFVAAASQQDVRSETLETHLAEFSGHYDAVCAFQVLEHICSPTVLFAQMVQAVKPGGLVIVGVPQMPSAMTRIPNFLLNAPPHHLTWWTKAALTALAENNGTAVETIDHAPWGGKDSLISWIERCSPIKCKDQYFRGAWSWHAATAFGLLFGYIVHAILKTPRHAHDEGAGLLLIARRPAV